MDVLARVSFAGYEWMNECTIYFVSLFVERLLACLLACLLAVSESAEVTSFSDALLEWRG